MPFVPRWTWAPVVGLACSGPAHGADGIERGDTRVCTATVFALRVATDGCRWSSLSFDPPRASTPGALHYSSLTHVGFDRWVNPGGLAYVNLPMGEAFSYAQLVQEPVYRWQAAWPRMWLRGEGDVPGEWNQWDTFVDTPENPVYCERTLVHRTAGWGNVNFTGTSRDAVTVL